MVLCDLSLELRLPRLGLIGPARKQVAARSTTPAAVSYATRDSSSESFSA
ncbi:hypothetical protein KV205_26640 [Streptomyces sp. SKN60]|nr:hypothetical protein [Streptomyces sp. SKN60]MCX2184081.1 hypothetical protein [Streptomyces sp. SKN60]